MSQLMQVLGGQYIADSMSAFILSRDPLHSPGEQDDARKTKREGRAARLPDSQ